MSTTRSQKRRNDQQEGDRNVSEDFVSPIVVENSCSSNQDVELAGPSRPKSPRIENSPLENLRASLKEEITSEIKNLLIESQKEMLELLKPKTRENIRDNFDEETENESRSFYSPTKSVRINSTQNDPNISRNSYSVQWLGFSVILIYVNCVLWWVVLFRYLSLICYLVLVQEFSFLNCFLHWLLTLHLSIWYSFEIPFRLFPWYVVLHLLFRCPQWRDLFPLRSCFLLPPLTSRCSLAPGPIVQVSPLVSRDLVGFGSVSIVLSRTIQTFLYLSGQVGLLRGSTSGLCDTSMRCCWR